LWKKSLKKKFFLFYFNITAFSMYFSFPSREWLSRFPPQNWRERERETG
jgi:hypothetical protein